MSKPLLNVPVALSSKASSSGAPFDPGSLGPRHRRNGRNSIGLST
jgi:hypothetical protein